MFRQFDNFVMWGGEVKKQKMYSASIMLGTMYASEIESVPHDSDVLDIYDTAKAGNPVIIGTDFNQLKAMADQMGLAFVPESV